ncbi:SUN domain-containing ossification factor-like [Branchiostoma floridae x Branchiostoma belcheri]
MWNGLLAVLLLTIFLNSLYTNVQSSPTEVSAEESVHQQQTKDKSQDCPVYLVDMTTGGDPGISYPTTKSTSSNKGTKKTTQNHQEKEDSLRVLSEDEGETSPEQPVASEKSEETETSASPSPASDSVAEDLHTEDQAEQTDIPVPVITSPPEPEQSDTPAADIATLKDSQTKDDDTATDEVPTEAVLPAEGTDISEDVEPEQIKPETVEDDVLPKAEEEQQQAGEEPLDTQEERETAVTEEEDLVAHKEDDMPSFDEWKKRMLEQEEREKQQNTNGQTGQPVSTQGQKTQKGRHNYGSVECGAKILSANREVQHSSSVLVENKDMYMLNPCSAKIWFIVELCEPIQLKQIDIANFELFSSVPESFKVSTSERYPAREWQLLGTFHMANERTIQSFPLDEKLFIKYLKVEMLSHYGSEHYCPLSLFRVFGTSMEEEIEETEQHSETVGDPEDDLFPDESVPLSPDSNLFGSAKDAVLNIVKQAAKVFTGPSDGMASTEPHEAKGKVSVEKTFLEPTLEYPEPCLDINRTVNVSVADHDGAGKDSRSIQPTPTSAAHSTVKHTETSEDQTPPLAFLPLDPSLQEETGSVQDKNSIQPTVSLGDSDQEGKADLDIPVDPASEQLSEGIVTLVESGIVEGSTPSVDLLQEKQWAVIKQCPTCSELQAVQKCQGRALCLLYQLILQTSCEEELMIVTPPLEHVVIATDTHDDEGTLLNSNVVDLSKKDEDGDISGLLPSEPPAPGTEQVLTESAEGEEEQSLPVSSGNDTVAVSEAGTEMSTTSPTLQHGQDSSPAEAVHTGEDSLQQEQPVMSPQEGSESPSAVQEDEPTAEGTDSSTTSAAMEGSSAEGSQPPVTDTAQSQSESETSASASDPGSSQNGGTKQTHVPDRDTKEDIVTSASQDSQDPSLPEPGPATVQNGSMDALDKQTKNASDFYAEKNENGTSAQHISHGGHTGKESVIMRLNNRIKALELNMSLSSRYLEELSQRYRKQMDEMQKAFNKTISKLTNNSRKAEERDIRQQEIIANLVASITNLTADVQHLNTDRDNLHRKVIERHIFLMVVEVLCLAVVFMVCLHTRPGHTPQLSNSQGEKTQEHLHHHRDGLGVTTRTEDLPPRRSDGEEDRLVIVEPQCNRQIKGTDGTKKKRSKKKHRYQGLRNTSSTPNLAEQLSGHQEVAAGVNMNVAGLLFSSSTAQDGQPFSSSRDSKGGQQNSTHHQPTLQPTKWNQQPSCLKNESSERGETCQEPALQKVFLCCGKTHTSVH